MSFPQKIVFTFIMTVMGFGGALMGLSIADILKHDEPGFWSAFDGKMMEAAGILIGLTIGFVSFKHLKQLFLTNGKNV